MADRFSRSLQENLIVLLATSDESGKIIASTVAPETFEGDYRIVAERCIEYWRKYQKAPGDHLDDLMYDELNDKGHPRATAFKRIVTACYELAGTVNEKYILDSVRHFKRMQAMKRVIMESADKLNAGQEMAISEIEALWTDLLNARQIDFQPGMRLADWQRFQEFHEKRQGEFTTGIRELDERYITPARGTTLLFLGPPGRGKTWFCISCGVRALLQRKKVLHISLEMGEEETAGRYYQSMFGVTKREVAVWTTRFEVGEHHRFAGFHRERINVPFTLESSEATVELQARVRDPRFGMMMDNLIIKSFPSGSLKIEELEAYMDNLETTEGFIPDLLILDYIGITDIDERNPRISLGRNFVRFRGACQRRNIAGVTAQQTRRRTAGGQQTRTDDVAEDWSMLGTTDMALLYAATDAEFERGLGRITVGKARGEEDRFMVLISQAYKMGQFCLDSIYMPRRYLDKLKAFNPRDLSYAGDDDDDEGENEEDQ